jgi:hypothetical protein
MRRLKNDTGSMRDMLLDMNPEAREHFMQLIDLLLLCFTDPPQASAVILLDKHSDAALAIASANASEIELVELIREAAAAMAHVIVADAPPKEMFN